jgi:UDP-N-acetylmuramoyl-tripeptide--D-alanyl-D-alanine ligase
MLLKKLEPSHQVFIVEIGAYKRGDTRAIAQLIKPQIGILTGLDEQHLERFGSMENIIATESELLEELPPSGTAILNRDDVYYVESAKHIAQGANLISFSLKTKRAGRFEIDPVEIAEIGSKFILRNEVGKEYQFSTKLLGKHNVSNILAGTLAAHALGMDLEGISEAVASIESPEHRLKPIKRKDDIIVLDDSYNVNPDGAQAALEVLNLFKDRRKIVLTHGLVELGKLEQTINREFGANLAKVADIVIVAGPKTHLIKEGLKSSGFSGEILEAEDINEAVQKLQIISKAHDVILVQTDLPDSYY